MQFKELNKDNWRECVKLMDEGDIYIAPNLYSIAEAQFYEELFSRAIYVDDKMVGYAMFGEDEDDSTLFFLDRLMIAKAYRRRGYATMALQKFIEIGSEMGFKRFGVSSAQENVNMHQLLERSGFQTDRTVDEDNEITFYKTL